MYNLILLACGGIGCDVASGSLAHCLSVIAKELAMSEQDKLEYFQGFYAYKVIDNRGITVLTHTIGV
jgi:hypothetical protein